jgi:transposase
MLANVRQVTIRPVIEATIAKGALVHTDEYDVYARLEQWGYRHKAVCHARGEYARDDDGDGFREVHVNTAEGLWSLLRSWLRAAAPGHLTGEAARLSRLLPGGP